MVILVILTDFFNIHYLISTSIGFITASTLNYVLSIMFVFHSGRFDKRLNEFILFFTLTLLGVFLNHGIMYLGHGILLINYKLVKIASLAVITFSNFFGKKHIVFLE